MDKMQQAFEAMMRVNGTSVAKDSKGKYRNPTVQVRWKWFQTGWEMRGLQ